MENLGGVVAVVVRGGLQLETKMHLFLEYVPRTHKFAAKTDASPPGEMVPLEEILHLLRTRVSKISMGAGIKS